MKKVELLAPAGNLEKLKYAIAYGADAVYAGVPDFSLRVRINNFNRETIKEAVEYVHQHKKKIYITLNIYAHNRHLVEVEKHLKFLQTLNIDGVIVSDPGIIMLVKKHLPKVDIHLSTQANATNWQAVKFWQNQGVSRVILAREVTLEEIKEIRKKVPKMELEYFVHGAMCMSYSGRCILSKWMTGRSANLGDCTQPCRWKYEKSERVCETSIIDDKKRFKIDMEEDQHGTYFLNSYDMNMLAYVDQLIAAGVDSLKIEGRAKSVYYLSTVVKAYRKAIDVSKDKKKFKLAVKEGQKELNNLVHRGYWTGFLLGDEPPHNVHADNFKSNVKFVGEIEGSKNGLSIVYVHNEIFQKDKLEVITPEKTFSVKIKKIYNHKMEAVQEAHGGHDKRYYFKFDKILSEQDLLRVKMQ
ncbi:MAG: U32 family peptidase C-terminal domain-containing protein [Parcubacteria group bacterium]|jgi:putative protease